jgi:peptidoglycan/LPS O-acetylase OafA/YrhL
MVTTLRTQPPSHEVLAANMSAKPRLEEIDIMRGMAIFLVVLGHIVAHHDFPRGNAWYWNLDYWIYHFHMPLFMYLSGLTFFLFTKPIANLRGYFRFLAQRAVRLLPALFSLGIIVIVAKYAFSGWLHVDNPVSNFWGDLLKLLYDPLGGALVSVWFVYTLFVIFVVVVPLLLPTKWNPYAVLIVGALLHFVPLPDYFCLSRVGEYLFMFGLGCIVAPHYQKIADTAVRYLPAFLVVFIVVSATSFIFMDEWSEDLKKMSLSLASLPVAHGIANKTRGAPARLFVMLGVCSFIIYLLNTVFIGITKALLLKFHSWDGGAFLFFLPTLLFAGIIGPVILKVKFFKKYRTLDRLTG